MSAQTPVRRPRGGTTRGGDTVGLIDRPRNDIPLALTALGGAIVAELCLVPFVLTVAFVPLVVVWIGIPLLLASVALLRWTAQRHRELVAFTTGTAIDRPYRRPKHGTIFGRLVAVIRDPATWRDLLWALVNATAGFVLKIVAASLFLASLFYVVYPLLFAITPPDVFGRFFGFIEIHHTWQAVALSWPTALICFGLWRWAGRPLLRADAAIARGLLGPTESTRLSARVEELSESRADTRDTSAAELRRIERDLHDGAQARLAALAMNLGMAESVVNHDPAKAGELLAEARQSAGTALTELRDLVRGIHPPVLADRGLDGGLQALALSAPFPVQVTVDLPARPPAPVESAGYFACAEAIANAMKHAECRSAWIDVSYVPSATVARRGRLPRATTASSGPGRIRLLVGDDGVGGAAVEPGGGLDGIQRRLKAFDGSLTVSSPNGGPTMIVMELPCEL